MRFVSSKLLAVVIATIGVTALASCQSCNKSDPKRDGLLELPDGEKPPLELDPIPAPPAVAIAPGSIPGVPAGPVTVVVARPQGSSRGGERPAITFNKPLVALGDRDATKPPNITIEPAVEGEWKWIGSSSVELAPAKDLPWATRFTVTVPAGLTAIDGEKLAEPYSFSFETLKPELTRTEPREGWRWLPRDGRIQLFFNQPMARDFAEHVSITATPVGGGAAVPVAFDVTAVVDVEAEEAKERGLPPPRERRSWGRAFRYDLTPRQKLPADARLAIELKPGLAAEEGPLTAEPKTITMSVAGPMKITSVRACEEWREECPYGPVLLMATNEPDIATLKGKVRFEPPVAVDDEETGSHASTEDGAWASIVGAFRPGTTYKVIIDAGVKDAQGQSAPAFTGKVKLDDVAPDLRIESSLALLEAGGDDGYPVETVNVSSVQADIEVLTPAQMAKALVQRADAEVGPTVRTSKTLDTSSERNVAVRKPLPLGDVFPAGTPRLFRLSITAAEVEGEPYTVLGQLTDLAAHAKLGATSGVVWVTSLSKGTPVAGATVTILSEDGAEVATATTDADGVARVRGLAGSAADKGDDWAPEVLVVAQKDADTGVTLSSWAGEMNPWAAGVEQGWDGTRADTLGVLVAERGIYRPGDDVYLKGIVRVRRLGELALPKLDGKMELKVRSDGVEISQETVAVSKFGTFSTKIRIPDGASLGWYDATASAKIDGQPVSLSTTFRVEEYRAPKFKVDVKVAAEHLVAGDALKGRAEARYLFGGAMPGAEVEATALRSTESFAPAGLERWSFGMQAWGFDDGAPEMYGDVFARSKTKIGNDGGVDLDLGVVEAPAGRTARYTLEADVADVSRQRVANRATVLVHPASVYAGVRVGDGFGEVGKPLPIELVAAAIDGTRASGVPLSVVVKRREWKSIKKKDPYSGRFTTISEPEEVQVTTCTKTSDAAAPVLCELTPDKSGLYLVEATATDDKGRKQTTKVGTYVAGGGWVSWQRTEGDLVELVADRKVYEPGQTARILVKSPWPEAEALVTVEREGVKSVRRVKLAGAASTFEVPLDDGDVPNVFASIVLVRGRVEAGKDAPKEIDPGRPQVRVGYVQLGVAKKKKALDVAVDVGQGTRRPGEKMKVKLAVRDFQKKGVPAEVALWAVDEAVLRLTDYSLPDLVEQLHPRRALSVRYGEPLVFLVKRQSYGQKGRPPGGDGGGGPGAGFRSNFKTTAFFVPSVVTDAQGNAEVEVQLPDDLTTYRVMALAVTEGDQAGAGKTEIIVQKPLLAMPALPRLARVGDTFSAGVIVHAQKPGDVKVTADVQGLVIDGAAEQSVHVEANRAVEVRFLFKAAAAGRARLRFTVQGGGESDGVEHFLPVVVPTFVETVAAAGDTTDKREEGLAPPRGVLADVGGLDVTLASTALAGYQEAMKQLVEYPYGCAEQLSSRLVPFMAVRELQGVFGLKHEGGAADQEQLVKWLGFPADATANPDEVARRTVTQLEALQGYDGGFRYWSSSGCSDATTSAWATLALARAQELGYPVSKGVVDKAQKFLAEKVAADKLPSCGWGERRASVVERTFAVWALARTGKPKSSFLEGLFQQRKDLPLFGKAMLADAHFVGGDAAAKSPRAKTLLQEVMNGAKETAREVHFEETDPGRWSPYWSSDVRTTAIVLMTLVDGQPDHPFVQKAAQYLQTAREGGRYRTTQEAAFALMAVGEVVRAKEREEPNFNASVSLGGKNVVTEAFQGRSLEIITRHVPMKDLGTDASSLVFAKTGTGTLSYTAALRYAKADMPTTALDAGMAVQRWFEPYAAAAGAGQARKVRAGELVRLKVRVATAAERRFVAVDVPLPAGLEIVDTSLASSGAGSVASAQQAEGGEGGEGDEGEYEGEGGYGDEVEEPYIWSAFNHVEYRDDRAVFFSDVLPPGVHTATVVARATTIGTWVLKPATAEEMYAPEVSGRSDGGTFEVVKE